MGMTRFSPPRRLTATDDISGFDCGLPLVNDWLAHHLHTADRQGTAVAYATFANDDALAGFYTLSAYSMGRTEVSGWLKRNSPNPIPVILLGMLGVDVRFQTKHVGSQLLQDATLRALNAAGIIGARALVVQPATDSAAQFYEHYGFRHIDSSAVMFTPLNASERR